MLRCQLHQKMVCLYYIDEWSVCRLVWTVLCLGVIGSATQLCGISEAAAAVENSLCSGPHIILHAALWMRDISLIKLSSHLSHTQIITMAERAHTTLLNESPLLWHSFHHLTGHCLNWRAHFWAPTRSLARNLATQNEPLSCACSAPAMSNT